MHLIGLAAAIVAFIIYSYYSYKTSENDKERKKIKRSMITIGGVWIFLLFLLSIPILFIIIVGKLQGNY
ncbi:hypothetical protein [Alkaliphilus crotonatoxidans]